MTTMPPTDARLLFDRCRTSVDAARITCTRAALLIDLSSRTRTEARSTRLRVLDRRARHETSTSFRVVGMVEDHPMVARWVSGHGLVCPDLLRRRAEIVVAMGETFGDDDGDGPRVAASLAGPTAALLTVLRALSRVTLIEVAAGSPLQGPGNG